MSGTRSPSSTSASSSPSPVPHARASARNSANSPSSATPPCSSKTAASQPPAPTPTCTHKSPRHAEVVDAAGRCVTPGFVDAHTHLVFAGNRAAEFEQRIAGATYQQIAAAGGGILRTVALTRAAPIEDDLLNAARRHRDWMLRTGTTTIEAKSGYGLDRDTELRHAPGHRPARSRRPGAHRSHAARRAHRSAGVCRPPRRICPLRSPKNSSPKSPAIASRATATPSATITPSPSTKPASCSPPRKRHGLRLRIHAEQFRPGTGAALAAELGAATADHLETVTERNAPSAPRRRRAACAAARLRLRPRPHAISARAQNDRARPRPSSSPPTSIPAPRPSRPCRSSFRSPACRWACFPPKPSPPPPSTPPTASTSAAEIGSLETGKRADFLIHEFADYRELAYFIAAPAHPRVFISGEEIAP